MVATLHYFHDPLCGWCYAAAPLVTAAAAVPGVALKLHGGGPMIGALRAGDHVAAEQHHARR